MTLRYTCVSCGLVTAADSPIYTCPKCQSDGDASGPAEGFRKGNLIVESLLPPAEHPGAAIDPQSSLPLPITIADSFPAGKTPIVKSERLASAYKLPGLVFKNDTLNPSGSLKDRASLLVAEQAISAGQDTIVLASTGNAGSAMACAGAAVGLRVILFVPESAPQAKLLQSLLYGARVVPIKGTYDDAFGLSVEYTESFGGINRNTAYNPMTVEGKKTAAIEIYNQVGGKAPDVVYVPTGDGVILSGIYKGFADLLRAGYTTSMPELVAVQAAGSNAISLSYRSNTETVLSSATTVADSIAVASPAAGELALRALRETGGRAVEADDTDISRAQAELAGKAGLFVEPSSAAAWSGCIADRHHLDTDSTAVVLLTGSGFKDLEAASSLAQLPPACEARLGDAVAFLADHYTD